MFQIQKLNYRADLLKEKKMSKKHKKYVPEPKFEYTDDDILEVWTEIEESEPDISTERLAAMVADRCDCDVDDVFEALVNANN